MESITRTEAQRKALEEYNEASRLLSAASIALQAAREEYKLMTNEYLRAWGAAKALGVI